MADEESSDQLVDVDGSRFVVVQDDEGKDVAVPIDDNYSLAEIKKAEASVIAEREKTTRALQEHKTRRLYDITGTLIILAAIATCALT